MPAKALDLYIPVCFFPLEFPIHPPRSRSLSGRMSVLWYQHRLPWGSQVRSGAQKMRGNCNPSCRGGSSTRCIQCPVGASLPSDPSLGRKARCAATSQASDKGRSAPANSHAREAQPPLPQLWAPRATSRRSLLPAEGPAPRVDRYYAENRRPVFQVSAHLSGSPKNHLETVPTG